MDEYYITCFIHQHPPQPGEQETTMWFKQVCGMFRNDLPTAVINHITTMSRSDNNLVLTKLIAEYVEMRNHIHARSQLYELEQDARRQQQKLDQDARKQQQKLEHDNDYNAYIVRRDMGNIRAHEAKIKQREKIQKDIKDKIAAAAEIRERESYNTWAPKMKEILIARNAEIVQALI